MRLLLKKNLPLILLLIFETVLIILNYQYGTFLVGWDNLYPELNFTANLKRNLFSIWQEYRGLGLPDGMAYAANLPHTLFIWFLSLFLPLSSLRYFFIFLMHFLGGIGMYFLCGRFAQKTSAFLAAIFYLVNLATIQMFYAPLEAFVVHFAFLPWLIYFLLSNSWRNFVIFSILSLPQAFLPQLFLVYVMLVFCLVGNNFKKAYRVFLIIFAVNSYWLLPYIYHLPVNSKIIINSKINQMSSEEIYQKNKLRGNFFDVVTLKGFMLDVTEFNKDSLVYIMQSYRHHIQNLYFNLLALMVFFISLVGVIISMRKRAYLGFLVAFLICFFFLGNDIWGLSSINTFLRDHIPILGEAFRFSFTKFITAFALLYSIFLAIGLQSILKYRAKILAIIFFSLLIIYSLPIFQGHFFFSEIKKDIPQEYFDAINFFKNQDINTRIVMFPIPSFWSWRYLKNGYRGSGFLWYGIEQAQLDRAFDPWSNKNENFYWEASYALSSQDGQLLEEVLHKYRVDWIVLDKNLIYPQSPQITFADEKLIRSLPNLKKVSTLGNILIFKLDPGPNYRSFISIASNLPSIMPTYHWNNFDTAYVNYQDYISSDKSADIYYPFRTLFTNQNLKEFILEEGGENFILKQNIPEEFAHLPFNIPDEKIIWFDEKNLINRGEYLAKVNFDGKTLTVEIPKVKGYFSQQIDPSKNFDNKNCDYVKMALKEGGEAKSEIVDQKILRLISKASNGCLAISLPNLSHHLSYLITIESRNIKNNSFVFWLENISLKKPDQEIYLTHTKQLSAHYFIQPPMDPFGTGYTLHFDNKSFTQDLTINDLGQISIYPIPYSLLTNLSFTKSRQLTTKWEKVEASHPLPFLYFVKAAKDNLVLYQSFDPGWYAFGASDHVLVNNWANGWRVGKEGKVIIIFLPQLLEFLGFGILILALFYLSLGWSKSALRRRI